MGKGVSPTMRTLGELRKRGYRCQVVERWISFANRRVDLFDVIDILAIRENEILGVQACAASGLSARRKKITETEFTSTWQWLKAGGRLEIWAWGLKKVTRGGKAKTWQVNVEEVRLEDLKGDETVFSRHLLGDHSEKEELT